MIPAAVLPVVLLANPGDESHVAIPQRKNPAVSKPKRTQSAKQRAASLKNLRKARAARAPKKNPTPKAKAPKKKGSKTMAKQSAKARAASLKNLRKARAARKSSNPTRSRRYAASAPKGGINRRRRNPDGGKTSVRRMVALAEVGSGVLVGGLAAGGLDYAVGGTAMFATPGKRALLHGGIGLVVGVGGAVAMPKAMGFFGGVGGAFLGLAASNGLRWAWAGTGGTSKTSDAPAMQGVVPSPSFAPGHATRVLAAGGGVRPRDASMQGVVMDPSRLRAIVQRGPKPTAR